MVVANKHIPPFFADDLLVRDHVGVLGGTGLEFLKIDSIESPPYERLAR